MKTTIKIDASRALVIEPAQAGKGVLIAFVMFGATMGGATLTPEQSDDVVSAMEIALEQSQKAA